MDDGIVNSFAAGRHLLFHRISRRINCTVPAIDEFPAGFFTKEQRLHGAVIIHVLVAIYILVILGIICHEYFVPSIEKFVSYCHIESDVTGASIMAAAGSAPQLATSIIGVFVAKSDIGVGSVVGASYLNIFFIVGLCPFFIKEPIKIAWWPLVRDSFFYCLAAASVAVLIADKKIHVYDAAIMVCLYAVYIIVLVFNARLEHCFSTCVRVVRLGFARCSCKKCRKSNLRGACLDCDPEPLDRIPLQRRESQLLRGDEESQEERESKTNGYHSFSQPASTSSQIDKEKESPQNTGKDDGEGKEKVSEGITGEEQEKPSGDLNVEPEYHSILHKPESRCKRVVWVILLPALFLVFIIVPDCRRPGTYRYMFVVTMLISVIIIGLCSYVLVWMVAIIGSTIGIPDTVMGLTFLAAGSSVPDIFNAILVTKHGYGDMAISNCIGSNIFDILISLGLPWLLHSFITDLKPLSVFEDVGAVSISLVATAFIFVVCLYINKFKLNKWLGGIFIGAYLGFVAFNIIFDTSTLLPDCESVS